MEEIFKDVVGFETLFQISNLGRVFSKRSNKLLKLHTNKTGYVTLATKIGGRQGFNKCFKIHRLVAEAFIPNPTSKPQVNHLDGNKGNNIASNLEWVTCKENIVHAFSERLNTARNGTDNINSKLSEEDVREIRLSNKTTRVLGAEYGVSHTQILKVKKRLSYKDVLDSVA